MYMLRKVASTESRALTACTGDDTAIHGAACYLLDWLGHLCKCRPTPPSYVMHPDDRNVHWLPIVVDGTSRHEASYVNDTLGGTTTPNQLSYWWLLALISGVRSICPVSGRYFTVYRAASSFNYLWAPPLRAVG